VLQAVFFAFTTRLGLPPDETYHLSYIKLFSENNFSPFLSNQEGYFSLGEAVRTPFFLYHYLLSFPYSLSDNFVFMRLINVALGVGSLVLVALIAGELKVPKLVRNLSIFMAANTLMLVFLAGSVSYDNLFIVLSLSSILLAIRLFNKITATHLLLLVACLAAGSLVKINFLPLAAALMIILAVRYHQSYKSVWAAFQKTFAAHRRVNMALCVLVAFLSVLVLHRYGYNVVKYRTYAPACTQVQSLEQCRQHALFVRNETVLGRDHPKPDKDPFEYVYDWIPLIQDRTFGIYGHQDFTPIRIVRASIQILIVLAAAAVIRAWRKKDRLFSLLIGISLFYTFMLLLENYDIYTRSGRMGFVVHGRHMLAVLPVLYIIGNHYMLKVASNLYVKTGLVLMIIAIFAASSLPTYAIKANKTWLNPPSARLLRKP